MKRRAAILLVGLVACTVLVQACSRPLPPQDSCNFVQNPELQRVSWKGRVPVKLYLHSSVPTEAYAAIDRAVTEYNSKIGHEMFRVVNRGVEGDLNPQKDGYSMIYWFNTWDADRPTEQARTTIYWTGNEIFEADMRINAHNFQYNYDENSGFSDVDLDSLVLHELGHVLGLAHNPTKGSAMNATLDEGQERRELGESTDVASLKCEY